MSGIKVIVTESLTCGHEVVTTIPMKEGTVTLDTPFPKIDVSRPFPALVRTLEFTGEHEQPELTGIAVKDGELVCAECGTAYRQEGGKP